MEVEHGVGADTIEGFNQGSRWSKMANLLFRKFILTVK